MVEKTTDNQLAVLAKRLRDVHRDFVIAVPVPPDDVGRVGAMLIDTRGEDLKDRSNDRRELSVVLRTGLGASRVGVSSGTVILHLGYLRYALRIDPRIHPTAFFLHQKDILAEILVRQASKDAIWGTYGEFSRAAAMRLSEEVLRVTPGIRVAKNGEPLRRLEITVSPAAHRWITRKGAGQAASAVRETLTAWSMRGAELPCEIPSDAPAFRRATYGETVTWYLWIQASTYAVLHARTSFPGGPQISAVVRAALAHVYKKEQRRV